MSHTRPVSTRERILDGARRAFARLGYEATRVEDILQAAGVSRPTFYRVFRNKDEVYAEVSNESVPQVRSARDRVLEGAREAFGRLGYELTRVEDILEASGVSRPTFYRVFSSKQEAYEELDRIAVGYLRRALDAVARREGDFRDLLELTIASYFEWRIGLKLMCDGTTSYAEPPGLTQLRMLALREPSREGAAAPMLVLALAVAIDTLASSFRVDDAANAELVAQRRVEAVALVFSAFHVRT